MTSETSRFKPILDVLLTLTKYFRLLNFTRSCRLIVKTHTLAENRPIRQHFCSRSIQTDAVLFASFIQVKNDAIEHNAGLAELSNINVLTLTTYRPELDRKFVRSEIVQDKISNSVFNIYLWLCKKKYLKKMLMSIYVWKFVKMKKLRLKDNSNKTVIKNKLINGKDW